MNKLIKNKYDIWQDLNQIIGQNIRDDSVSCLCKFGPFWDKWRVNLFDELFMDELRRL